VVPSSKLRIEYVPISQLKKNPHNARSHSPGQIAKLKASARTFGFVVPVLADEQDMLHARVTAAEQLGFSWRRWGPGTNRSYVTNFSF